MIDLHTHSTFSDGTMKPTKLVSHAESRGVEVLALTDHDTVDGLDEFFAAETSMELVAGVEISVAYEPGAFHLVGLFIDYKDKNLVAGLDRLKRLRRERNIKMCHILSEFMGYEVGLDDLSKFNDGELGRPHIAEFLVKNRKVRNMQEAFDLYLADGKPMCVKKERMEFAEAVELIHGAGGITVLAHPLTLRVEEKRYKPFIEYLKGLGLDAVEVFCSDTPEEKIPMFHEIARELDMGISGGSDYHGDNKLRIGIGRGPGYLETPVSVYHELKAKFSI